MSDKEKMQKLFDAALRDPHAPEAIKSTPTCFIPKHTPAAFQPAPPPVPPIAAAVPPAPFVTASSPPTAPIQQHFVPLENTGLDATSSAELATLLDERHQRKTRRRRLESLVTALVLLGLSGGGYAWFVQSPQRIQAFNDATKEIKSAGDITGIVSKYQAALEKVKLRSEQIDSASSQIGSDPSKNDQTDPYFQQEMQGMIGGDRKTTAERDRLLKEKFGSMEKAGKPGMPASTSAATIPPQIDVNLKK